MVISFSKTLQVLLEFTLLCWQQLLPKESTAVKLNVAFFDDIFKKKKKKKKIISNEDLQKQSCVSPAADFLESNIMGGLLCHLHVEQVDT